MGEIDRAEQIESQHRAAALAAQHDRARPDAAPREVNGQRLCLDCGEPIDPARLRAAPLAVRCRDCQNDHERQNRWLG